MSDSKNHILITTIGTDRPGLVQDISAWVLENDGNIEDSQMALLGGEFATLILISGDDGLESRITNSLEAFQSKNNLTVFTKSVSPAPPQPEQPVLRYRLSATGLDHSGFVHEISKLLGSLKVNIVLAKTHMTPAPFTGTPVFHFNMDIDIPSTLNISSLRDQLREHCDQQQIDFYLSAIA